MHARILFLVALAAAAAAAALPAAAAGPKIPVVNEGTIGDRWTLVPGTQLMPPYPEDVAGSAESVCMVIGYLVNADGTTSDFALLKSWTSGSNSRARARFWEEFGDLASRAVAQWKYVPKDSASAQPVYTATTIAYAPPQDIAATKGHCAIPELRGRLVALHRDERANRRMVGGIFSRLDLEPPSPSGNR